MAAPEDTVEKRQDMRSGEAPDGARSQGFSETGRESATNGTGQTPEEVEAPHTQPPPSQKQPGTRSNGDGEGPSQGPGDGDRGLGAEQGPQMKGEEEEEEARAGDSSEEEGPTAAGDSPASRGLEEVRKGKSTYDDQAPSLRVWEEGVGRMGPRPPAQQPGHVPNRQLSSERSSGWPEVTQFMSSKRP